MSVATYALAAYVGNVLDFFRYPPRRPGGGGKKYRSEDRPNIWRGLGRSRRAILKWLLDVYKEIAAPNSPPTTGNFEVKVQSTQNEQKPVEEESKSNGISTEAVPSDEPTPKRKYNLPWLRKSRGEETPSVPV